MNKAVCYLTCSSSKISSTLYFLVYWVKRERESEREILYNQQLITTLLHNLCSALVSGRNKVHPSPVHVNQE